MLLYLIVKRKDNKDQVKILSNFSFVTTNGKMNSTKNLPVFEGYAIVLFNPSCDLCIEEALDFSRNLHLFENYCLVFLSPDTLHKITKFMYDFDLAEKGNIFFGQLDYDSIEQSFGRVSIPGIFIYDSQKQFTQFSYVLNSSNLAEVLSK
jgi:hypothetical protein